MSTRATAFSKAPTADNYVRQGVTTLIEGPDGASPLPIGLFLERVAATGIAPNFGWFVGPGLGSRFRDGGSGSRRHACRAARDAPDRAAGDGGWRIRLEHRLVLCARRVYADGRNRGAGEGRRCKTRGIHISHMRDEAARASDSVRETIEIGEKGGLPTQVTHHKIIGALNWGTSVDTLRMVDEARAVALTSPWISIEYTAPSTSIHSALLPAWANEGGRERLVQRLRDASARSRIRAETIRLIREERGGGDPNNVQISACEWNPSLDGQAAERSDDRTEARTDGGECGRHGAVDDRARRMPGHLPCDQRGRPAAHSETSGDNDWLGTAAFRSSVKPARTLARTVRSCEFSDATCAS